MRSKTPATTRAAINRLRRSDERSGVQANCSHDGLLLFLERDSAAGLVATGLATIGEGTVAGGEEAVVAKATGAALVAGEATGGLAFALSAGFGPRVAACPTRISGFASGAGAASACVRAEVAGTASAFCSQPRS